MQVWIVWLSLAGWVSASSGQDVDAKKAVAEGLKASASAGGYEVKGAANGWKVSGKVDGRGKLALSFQRGKETIHVYRDGSRTVMVPSPAKLDRKWKKLGSFDRDPTWEVLTLLNRDYLSQFFQKSKSVRRGDGPNSDVVSAGRGSWGRYSRDRRITLHFGKKDHQLHEISSLVKVQWQARNAPPDGVYNYSISCRLQLSGYDARMNLVFPEAVRKQFNKKEK